ncbi:MAG: BLUF domain-containing protein [Polaromonas sp.]|uniref:BLUF domain-containing protein n=1 Tax=Polaromonas sp. TaxID=1869339 RepID=UPI00271E49A4|nr:BLUF domain-containing protein [Polaromonas sp.]MDO9113956.1 BLUF domain-containing protein [Polaromonas sp.]MDP1887363.1 BLUF domain-containing protein [Polaromonas sp.]
MQDTDHSAELHEVIYVSTLAPDAPTSVVADIVGKARLHNPWMGITGMLIFDGMRFCEQMEGSQKDVLAQLERIRQDTRHVNLRVVHQGPLAVRRFRRFSLGYTTLDDDDALGRLEALTGQDAIAAFQALFSTLDLDA